MWRCGPVTNGKPINDFGNFLIDGALVVMVMARGSITVCERKNFGRLEVGAATAVDVATTAPLLATIFEFIVDEKDDEDFLLLARGGRTGGLAVSVGVLVFCFEFFAWPDGCKLKRCDGFEDSLRPTLAVTIADALLFCRFGAS